MGISIKDIKEAYGYHWINIKQKGNGPWVVKMDVGNRTLKIEVEAETMTEVEEHLMERVRVGKDGKYVDIKKANQ